MRLFICALALLVPLVGHAQQAGPASQVGDDIPAATLTKAIGELGNLDFPIRSNASRTVRRAKATTAVPALLQAVMAHKDGYVRFRALVLLAGFNDPRARDVMLDVLDDPNDRLRDVAYAYFEANPDPTLTSRLLGLLEKEQSEFVRPSLIRAITALGTQPQVQDRMLKEVNRGQDFFRSIVIEALGDHKAVYAVPVLIKIGELDGPLRDDAVLALGEIGDKRALTLFANLQRVDDKALQPTVAAAICMLGVNCDSHTRFLAETLRFAVRNLGNQEIVRSTASGLSEVALKGDTASLDLLFDIGGPSDDPVRAPIALALGNVALKDPMMILAAIVKRPSDTVPLLLLRDAFDMLEEDYAEEHFFATIRRAYWQSKDGSAERKAAEALIGRLEF